MRGFPSRVIFTFFVALVVVIAASWYVGWRDPEEEFDWELAAIFGTAVGTTLLAISTGALAYLTGRDVSATKELAQLTRDDQHARERPVVVLHNAVYIPAGPHAPLTGHLAIHAFNAGLGPALNVRVEAKYKDANHQPEMKPAVWPVITAGGSAQFAIQPVRFEQEPPGGIDVDGFSVSGSFVDRSRSTKADIIVDWRTTSQGAHGDADQ